VTLAKNFRKQINGKFNNIGSADENTYIKKYHCRNFFLC
jgi:hypothetical protein